MIALLGSELGYCMLSHKVCISFQHELFLAGTDTTRIYIEWVLIYLSTMPKVQDRIYNEIKEKIGDRFPQVSDKLSKELSFISSHNYCWRTRIH